MIANGYTHTKRTTYHVVEDIAVAVIARNMQPHPTMLWSSFRIIYIIRNIYL